jgi:uncharacterized phage protein gp47/JayE
MTALLADLLAPRSEAQTLASLLAAIQTLSTQEGIAFSPNDFEPGALAHTLLRLDANALADLYAIVPDLARSGFLDTGEGALLNLISDNQYALTRRAATFTRGKIVLNCAAGFGPYLIQDNTLWVGVGARTGQRYLATALITPLGADTGNGWQLTSGQSITLEAKAENPGEFHNVGAGAINVLHTPLPGVTVTNPNGWILEAGQNEEGDELLRRRSRLRWSETGKGGTRDAYEAWARAASPAITKVQVRDDHPRGQGTVDVIVWGAGDPGSVAVQAAATYIESLRPLGANVQVFAATQVAINITGTIKIRAGYDQAAPINALGVFERSQPIGGVNGTLYKDALEAALFTAGVADVDISSPAADTTIPSSGVAVFTVNLTVQVI